jgi:hypothetical protein
LLHPKIAAVAARSYAVRAPPEIRAGARGPL